MKKLIIAFLFVFTCCAQGLFAQSTIQLDPKGDFKTWSDWHNGTVKGEDGKEYTYDYRVQLVKRKGIAVYYAIEIKNTCANNISGRVNFVYNTIWLNTPMNESVKFKCKAGQSTIVEYIQQGCKKTDKTKTDYQASLECPMDYTIYINTK
jgi:hypothetical protein